MKKNNKNYEGSYIYHFFHKDDSCVWKSYQSFDKRFHKRYIQASLARFRTPPMYEPDPFYTENENDWY